MAEEKIIRPNTQKNFLIARVGINKEKLSVGLINRDYAQIYVPMGYSLFYTIGNVFFSLPVDNQMVSSKEIFDRLSKDKEGSTTLYWVIKSDYQIVVPWGIKAKNGNIGYNGSISCKISDDGLSKFIKMKLCESLSESKGDLNYDYISEYFINQDNTEKSKVCGVSVALREKLLSYIGNCVSKEEIENTISSDEVKKCFNELGLTIVSHDIKEFSGQVTKSENSEDEDK